MFDVSELDVHMSYNCHFVHLQAMPKAKVKAMPKRLKTGTEFLGASAKAASSRATSRATFVNTDAFEIDEEDATFVTGGGACMEVDDDG